ncbi:hypothetical protein DFQ28_001892 [Apophysomyces sp. BC1034]|nr:hypothetical protein DFQ28_001892 [Apophysomyces sp. BC1034]
MEDFDTEELEEYRLWGIDPGITNTFVAADGCGSERHEYRAFSQSEFYTLAGRGGRSMRLPTAVIAKRKWKPRPVQQDARMPLFGFGDGQFSQSLRGQPAGLSKAFHKGLKTADRQGHLIVVQIGVFQVENDSR